MGINIPESLQTVAKIAYDADWPDADESKLKRVGEAWAAAGVSLDEIIDDADKAIHGALNAIDGDTHDAIADKWKEIGIEGSLTELADLYTALGEIVDGSADDIKTAKLAIIAALAILAAELVAVGVAAWFTFGAALAAAPVAAAATGLTVQIVMRTLIAAILRRVLMNVAKDAIKDAGLAALMELGEQIDDLLQGKRDSIDFGSIVEDGLRGGLMSVPGSVTTTLTGKDPLAAAKETSETLGGDSWTDDTRAEKLEEDFGDLGVDLGSLENLR